MSMRADRLPNVSRWPSGKRKYERQRSEETETKAVALYQPHRRGDEDQMLESPLGRFVRKYRLRYLIYQSAQAYKLLRLEWLRAFSSKGLILEKVMDARASPPSLEAPGPSWRTVRRWRAELDRIEKRLSPNQTGWRAARDLIDGREIALHHEAAAREALITLAKAQDLLGEKGHPFL
jgi:hypothetical protein